MKRIALLALLMLLSACTGQEAKDLTGAIRAESDARASAAKAQELAAQATLQDAQTRADYAHELARSYERYAAAQDARVREAQALTLAPLVALLIFGVVAVAVLSVSIARRPVQQVTVYQLPAPARMPTAFELFVQQRAAQKQLTSRTIERP